MKKVLPWKAEGAKASADEATRTAPTAFAHVVLKKGEGGVERERERMSKGLNRLILFFTCFICCFVQSIKHGKLEIHIFCMALSVDWLTILLLL
jgi:hypothetical protein